MYLRIYFSVVGHFPKAAFQKHQVSFCAKCIYLTCLIFYAVINCLPPPPQMGNRRAVAGTCLEIYRNVCSRRPSTTPDCTSDVTKCKIKYPSEVYPCPRCPRLWAGWRGPTQGLSRKPSPAVLGSLGSAQACTLDITKYKIKSLGKSPLSLGSGGQGYHW